jgi:hypothetical protein
MFRLQAIAVFSQHMFFVYLVLCEGGCHMELMRLLPFTVDEVTLLSPYVIRIFSTP